MPNLALLPTLSPGTSILMLAPSIWLAADQSTLWQDSGRTTPAVADSDPVGAWDDLSGNGQNFIQATSSKRPSLKLASQNGLPSVQFDGVDDSLVGAVVNNCEGTSGFTIFAVYRQTVATPALGQNVFSTQPSSGLAGWKHYLAGTDGQYTLRGGSAGNGAVWIISSVLPTYGTLYHVVSGSYNAGDISVYRDRVQLVYAATATTHDTTGIAAVIGANSSAGTQNGFFQGNLCELVVFNRRLPYADRQRVERLLQRKWVVYP